MITNMKTNYGKPTNIRNHQQVVNMDERQFINWENIEKCLKSDNSDELRKTIEGIEFSKIWRPENATAKGTILHKASELGSIDCIAFLIRKANENHFSIDSPDNNGNTALFMAVKALKTEAVKNLLEANAHVNARNDQGHTILHKIAYTLSSTSTSEKDKQETLLQCLDIVLNRADIDLDAKNKTHGTPLIDAADKISNSSNHLINFCRKLVMRGASLEACNAEGSTARMILEEKSALTPVLMGNKQLTPKRPPHSLLLERLMLDDNADLSEIFSGMAPTRIKTLANSYLGKDTILYYAVEKRNLKAVRILLEAGADPETVDLGGELCLHKALAVGNPEILELIISKMKDKHKVQKLNMRSDSFNLLQNVLKNHGKDLEPKVDVDHMKCMEILLKEVNVNVNAKVSGGISQSILHVAASHNNQEAARMFLERGAFLGDRQVVHKEDHGTVLKVLRSETLERAMDGCISHNQSDLPDRQRNQTEDISSPDHTLTFNYEFMTPPPEDNEHLKDNSYTPKNEVKTLMEIGENKIHRKALKHPLIQTFLYAKWRKVLFLYLLNLAVYLAFVIFLTLLMFSLKDLRIIEQKAAGLANVSNITDSAAENMNSLQHHANIYKGFLILITLYILVREIFQVAFTFRRYLKDFENYLEWFLIVTVIIFCFADSSMGVDSTRHFAAWAMIIAWYEFVLLLGRAPPLAMYVTMLSHVSRNFLKLIFLFGALILAFTFSFNIILQPLSDDTTSVFSSFGSTLPKSIVMATGEFDYSDLSESFFLSSTFYATSAILVFLVFVFLIFLVLMNVMSGLAVSDTQKVVEEATLYSLKSRLQLIYLIEEMLLVTNCKKIISMVQLFSDHSPPQLAVKVNLADEDKRIIYGNMKHPLYCKLDDDTADTVRTHRINQLTEESERTKVDPTVQCLQLLKELKEMATQNPQILRSQMP